jgi:hypothetical protein
LPRKIANGRHYVGDNSSDNDNANATSAVDTSSDYNVKDKPVDDNSTSASENDDTEKLVKLGQIFRMRLQAKIREGRLTII